jgi:hypothetical protein
MTNTQVMNQKISFKSGFLCRFIICVSLFAGTFSFVAHDFMGFGAVIISDSYANTIDSTMGVWSAPKATGGGCNNDMICDKGENCAAGCSDCCFLPMPPPIPPVATGGGCNNDMICDKGENCAAGCSDCCSSSIGIPPTPSRPISPVAPPSFAQPPQSSPSGFLPRIAGSLLQYFSDTDTALPSADSDARDMQMPQQEYGITPQDVWQLVPVYGERNIGPHNIPTQPFAQEKVNRYKNLLDAPAGFSRYDVGVRWHEPQSAASVTNIAGTVFTVPKLVWSFVVDMGTGVLASLFGGVF